jgi:hypothetical protein
MKTQNTKLDFTKNSITELNDQQLTGVAGGGSVGASISWNRVSNFYWPAITLMVEID